MREKRPTLDGLEQVLELIASDPRIPLNFTDWIRGSIRSGGGKNRVLRYILEHASANATPPHVLDVGAQFGALAVNAVKLGCRAAAVDYGPSAAIFQKVAADHGVEYKECDVGVEPLPFSENQFDFVTYTDVMEHHSFSPKRVLREIHRVLVQDLTSLLYYFRRHQTRAEILPESRDLLLCALGEIWDLLHLPLGRWIWAVGEKTVGGGI